MFTALITLIVISIILFAISFKMNDKFEQLETQVEQLSITTMQDTYQMQKKLKVLEEELLTGSMLDDNIHERQSTQQPPLIQEVHRLHEEGYSTDEIANRTKLNLHDVQTILRN